MKITVTVDIFSGRKNPQVVLEGQDASKFLDLIESGEALGKEETMAPFTLGYRGLIVEQDEASKSFPAAMRLQSSRLLGEGLNTRTNATQAERFILERLGAVKNTVLQPGFDKFLAGEMASAARLHESLDWGRIAAGTGRFAAVDPCECGTIYEPKWWNDNLQVLWNNNCYNYACNYRTDTFAQPGLASGNMYTSLSGCTVAPGQVSAHDGAVSDSLISTPLADNNCTKKGNLVALVIWPGVDFHWYRKDYTGYWSHKPGSTNATDLDNSGNVIPDPRTADRGGYTQFCTFMVVIEGHIKII